MIYLIHLDTPLSHARHYVWFVDGGPSEVAIRLQRHRSGKGSKMLRAVSAAGIAFDVVRTFPGSRDDERRLKRMKHAHRYCPVCHARPHNPKHLKETVAKVAAVCEPIPF